MYFYRELKIETVTARKIKKGGRENGRKTMYEASQNEKKKH